MQMSHTKNKQAGIKARGFTLVEIAVVLLIITLLMTGLVPTISSQIEQRQTSDTRKQLNEIQQALMGFVIINERFPCPASTTSNGLEDVIAGSCTTPNGGFIPAATLGLAPTNSQGLVVDAWNNPIRYAVTSSYGSAFTSFTPAVNGIKTIWTTSPLNLDLQVCSTAVGITAANCAANTLLSSNGVPAVIFSTGKNGGIASTNPDEAVNVHTGAFATYKTFVSHEQTATYDDMIVWVSHNTLFNRMVTAGKLP